MTITVFIVEDSHQMQSALADLFHALEGFEVVGYATSDVSATRWLLDNRGRWDLATVDLILDEGSGFNVVKRCKTQPDAGTVVVLSDFVTPAVAERCRAFGADAVFHKSDVKQFSAFLVELVKGRAAATESPPMVARAPPHFVGKR